MVALLHLQHRVCFGRLISVERCSAFRHWQWVCWQLEYTAANISQIVLYEIPLLCCSKLTGIRSAMLAHTPRLTVQTSRGLRRTAHACIEFSARTRSRQRLVLVSVAQNHAHLDLNQLVREGFTEAPLVQEQVHFTRLLRLNRTAPGSCLRNQAVLASGVSAWQSTAHIGFLHE